MSAELLRRVAANMREVAEKAADQPQTDVRSEGVWLRSRFHMTIDPTFALAVADLLNVWADNNLLGSPFTLPEEAACITDLAHAYLGEPSDG